ncbi:PE-PPE domain-containing protein [Mycolicibacterium chubuense]|uniref:PE-PPE domain-containing protein n=1 Tax=Mycolicibacterium chubuense TaxID=1800 RepID=UPI0002E3A733|nr:PE-PPE domain-containing protein [Mycolicibacterium chubuense]
MIEAEKVLTLGGLNFGVTDQVGPALHGYAAKSDRIVVKYPQAASMASIRTGVQALQRAVRSALSDTDGLIDVVAHSQGAEVVSEWLYEYGHGSDAPPAHRLRFILLGNPRRRLGGAAVRSFDGKPVRRTPDDTRYTVLDVTRAQDGWSNNDGWPAPHLTFGMKARLLVGRMIDHVDYGGVDLDTAQVRARVGNTTYLVAP